MRSVRLGCAVFLSSPRPCVVVSSFYACRAVRYASGSTGKPAGHAGVEAVDWTYSQADAHRLFQTWWAQSTPSLALPEVSAIRSVYLPFWVFIADVSVPRLGVSMHREAPSPALQLYAGSQYPRKMTEVRGRVPFLASKPCATRRRRPRQVLKNDYAAAQPFRSSLMQRDFRASRTRTGSACSRLLDSPPPPLLPALAAAVEVEPFELYEGTAWSLARTAWIAHERTLHSAELASTLTEANVRFRSAGGAISGAREGGCLPPQRPVRAGASSRTASTSPPTSSSTRT